VRSHAKALFAVTALFMLLGVSQAQASKTVNAFFGNPTTSSGNKGGEFSTPRGVAVNVAGTGGASAGDIYVIDSSNNRIQRFSAAGVFLGAWGKDVETGGATGYEICATAANCKAAATSTGLGGELNSPQGIAIDQATGNVYVTEQSGLRVQVFSATGGFIRAFGQDVVQTGQAGDAPTTAAKQTLKVDASAGQFKLSFRGQTTADIEFNASAAAVQSALQALSTVGAGNATVTGGPGNEGGTTPYVITFAGALNNAPMPLISAAAGTTPLSGAGATASVTNTTTGSTGFEVCTVAANCKAGATGTAAGAFASTFGGHLAVAPTGAPNAGDVIVADPGNRRVQEFTAAGAFVRAFGFNVTSSPPNAVTTFETCDASNFDVCQAGVAGSGTGQFATNTPNRVAVDSTGAIYTVEPTTASFRVQKFTLAGPTLTPSAFADATLKGTSSSGSTQNNPTDIAIGAADKVFVVKVFPVGAGTPAATVLERRVLELDSTGTLLDTHIAGAVINGVNGLAANASNGRLYLTSTSVGSPAQNFQRLYVLADAVAPTATIAAADNVNAAGATLHGTVNPGGVLAGYHFEYVDDASFQATAWANVTALPETEAGNANSASPVSRVLEGLAANTLYHVRLVATHSFGPLSGTSGETTFTTGAAKPIVAPFASADSDTTSATLFSRVTANGQATSYRFEWGLTAGYGNSTPATAVGSGITSVAALDQITGLQPDTTYHFRITATSPSGTTTGDDHPFTTDGAIPATCPNAELRKGVAALLPDCRAYEQVSPVEKNGSGIESTTIAAAGALDSITDFGGSLSAASSGPVSSDGNAVAFRSVASFADSSYGGTSTLSYVAFRDAQGWLTHSASPRITPAFRPNQVWSFSPDMRRALLSVGGAVSSEPALSINLLLSDFSSGTLSSFLVSTPSTLSPTSIAFAPLDPGHFFFADEALLTAEPDLPGAAINKIYEYVDGELRLASRQPGSDSPFQAGARLGDGGLNTQLGIVSADGRSVFFTTPGKLNLSPESQIYRRTDGANTVLVSPSKRIPPDGSIAGKGFMGASEDGNKVFFSSAQRLTNDANSGIDLYRYDVSADRLVDLTAGTAGSLAASVQGVVDFSDDGNRVYFVALGQVVPGEGIAGQPNLYLWEDDGTDQGAVRFIGTLDPSSAMGGSVGVFPEDRFNWTGNPSQLFARATPDGSSLIFSSRASLTGFDNHQSSPSTLCSGNHTLGGRCAEIYLYKANGAGELSCLSCRQSGLPSNMALIPSLEGGLGGIDDRPRAISDDGERAVFTSPDPLLGRDTNAEYDAYLWQEEGNGFCQRPAGCLSLLSTGTGGGESYAAGLSADGDDAFFRTYDRLVGQDGDTLSDLYTAHVGGGFASQSPTPPPSCSGEECRGGGSQPPAGGGPLTSAFMGTGNVKAGPAIRKCGKGKHRVKLANGKTRCSAKRHGKRKAHKRTESKTRRTH
jgi:hypothetical protein